MPLNTPISQTISVFTDIDGKRKPLDLTTVIAELAPQLCVPSIIEFIKNNQAVDTSRFSVVEYQAVTKTHPTVTYKDGKPVESPADVKYQNLTINAVKLRPTQIIDKYQLKDIDRMTNPEYQNLLASKVVEFTEELRIENEIILFNNLCCAAKGVQEKIVAAHPDAITFKKGAHFVASNLTTSDEIYDAIVDAKQVIQKIGNSNAKTMYDANYKYARGITLDNVILLINEEVKDNLLKRPGLFASDAGLELFKNAGITKICGLNTYSTNSLPDGVNFVITTVGKVGSIAFNKVADKDWFSTGPDAKWEKDIYLHCSREQVMGILYEQTILVSTQEDVELTEMNKYGSTTPSTKFAESAETFSLEQQKESTFNAAKETAKSWFKEKEPTVEEIKTELARIREKLNKNQELAKKEKKFLEKYSNTDSTANNEN